eukprot:scaffold4170_cov330-Prasinococcus_capsulatus_cf.AAC.2
MLSTWSYRDRWLVSCARGSWFPLRAWQWRTWWLTAWSSSAYVARRARWRARCRACAGVHAQQVGCRPTTVHSRVVCWTSCSPPEGAILAAYASGALVQDYGPRPVFAATACLPLLLLGVSLILREEPREVAAAGGPPSSKAGDNSEVSLSNSGSGWKAQVALQAKELWGAVRQQRIAYPALFLFAWQAAPSPRTALFQFYTNELGFDAEFLGRVSLATSVASLLGVGLYNGYLKRVPLRSIFKWSTLLGLVLSSTQLVLVLGLNRRWGVDDQLFAIADSVALTVLGQPLLPPLTRGLAGQVAFMPTLVLAARICPEGVEATLFALLMSILNAGGVSYCPCHPLQSGAGPAAVVREQRIATSGLLGGGLTSVMGVTSTDFSNLAPLLVLCNASSLLPLLLLPMVPAEPDKAADDPESKVL